jgi:DNA topoisomerase III
MEVAERLYNKGLISYPRTETNAFTKTLDLNEIVTDLKQKKNKLSALIKGFKFE